MFAGQGCHLIEVDALVLLADAVVLNAVKFTGEVQVHPVRQVAAVSEVHRQDRIARFEAGEVDGHVRLRSRVRLNVGMLGAEQFQDALDGEALGDVHELAAAVVALAGIALGVLVRQLRSLGGQHSGAGVIFGSDHLQPGLLPASLRGDGLPDFRVELFDGVHALLHSP